MPKTRGPTGAKHPLSAYIYGTETKVLEGSKNDGVDSVAQAVKGWARRAVGPIGVRDYN